MTLASLRTTGMLVLVMQCLVTSQIVDVTEYWPLIANDLTMVTWSHATNSREQLTRALADDAIMMIEADVLLGRLDSDDPGTPPRPVMAHPPLVVSDLTLEDFVTTIIQALEGNQDIRKGFKLDFKGTYAAEEGLSAISSLKEQINCPVWINADIARGPGTFWSGVDADRFLAAAGETFPEATISVGWTTLGIPGLSYTWDMVRDMKAKLEENGYLGTGKGITYPIRAMFLRGAVEQFQWLLEESSQGSPPSTVTIWGSDDLDPEEQQGLESFVAAIGEDKCYTDLPDLPYQGNLAMRILHSSTKFFYGLWGQ